MILLTASTTVKTIFRVVGFNNFFFSGFCFFLFFDIILKNKIMTPGVSSRLNEMNQSPFSTATFLQLLSGTDRAVKTKTTSTPFTRFAFILTLETADQLKLSIGNYLSDLLNYVLRKRGKILDQYLMSKLMLRKHESYPPFTCQ